MDGSVIIDHDPSDRARNTTMTNSAVKYLSELGDNGLVVVGAGHLYGNDGLIEQFKANGYDIEKIENWCFIIDDMQEPHLLGDLHET